ncbi:MAG: YdcH family protein [Acidobacteriota bacterium]|jgi:uncharacterized protein YdcH (DUF465 family)
MPLVTDEELKTQLMSTDPEFRRLAVQHSGYSRLLDELESKQHRTEAEVEEEARLKKIKLALKDQMQGRISEWVTQQT